MINMIYSNDYPIENKLALQLAQSSITSTLEWFKSTFVSDINSQFVLALSPSEFRNNVLKTMSVLSDDLNNSPFAAKSLTNALISKNITYKTPANDLTEFLKNHLLTAEWLFIHNEASNFKTTEELEKAINENSLIHTILWSIRKVDNLCLGNEIKRGILIPMKIQFIKDFLEDKFPKENTADAPLPSLPKLKTNLSVPELAYLFKMLNELKPNIFSTTSNAELYRFISANFSSKKSEAISTDKLNNLNSDPDENAIDFWKKHLSTLYTNIKKL